MKTVFKFISLVVLLLSFSSCASSTLHIEKSYCAKPWYNFYE